MKGILRLRPKPKTNGRGDVTTLSVVGNCEALGSWDPTSGVQCRWAPELGAWVACAQVPQLFNLEYKYVIGNCLWLPDEFVIAHTHVRECTKTWGSYVRS